jgi:hypothetical protein
MLEIATTSSGAELLALNAEHCFRNHMPQIAIIRGFRTSYAESWRLICAGNKERM